MIIQDFKARVSSFYKRVRQIDVVEDQDQDQNQDKELSIRLQSLPEEVVFYIYKEFLEADVYYQMFQRLLHTRESVKLDIASIRPMIPTILSKPHVVSYFVKHNACFDRMYRYYKIDKEKHFTLMKKGNSFALSLLMCLYH